MIAKTSKKCRRKFHSVKVKYNLHLKDFLKHLKINLMQIPGMKNVSKTYPVNNIDVIILH